MPYSQLPADLLAGRPIDRPNGLFRSFEVFFIYAHRVFETAHHLFETSPAVVSQFVGAGRRILWQEAQVFQRLKDTAFLKVVVRETWFSTT